MPITSTTSTRTSVVLGLGVGLVVIVLGYLLNPVWYHFHKNGLHVDVGYALSSFVAFFGGWVLLGVVFGLTHVRNLPVRLAQLFRSIGLGFGSFYLLMIVFEILWYEPWTMHEYVDEIGHQSHMYNAYQLDAVYGTPLIIIMILVSLFAYICTIGVSLILKKFLPRR